VADWIIGEPDSEVDHLDLDVNRADLDVNRADLVVNGAHRAEPEEVGGGPLGTSKNRKIEKGTIQGVILPYNMKESSKLQDENLRIFN
jgi:hypothetical protein